MRKYYSKREESRDMERERKREKERERARGFFPRETSHRIESI